jgi:hypothetical protein
LLALLASPTAGAGLRDAECSAADGPEKLFWEQSTFAECPKEQY